jgi:Ca2+-binding RTX toxin-like protein
VGDIDGDGFDDLIVGTKNCDDDGSNAGEGYVIFGHTFAASSAPRFWTGTAASDTLIGAVGDDTLTGGGADVFRAGAGNDRIVVSGSTAVHRLVIEGDAGDTLDLRDSDPAGAAPNRA